MRRGLIDPDAEHKLHRDLARRIDPRAILDHYEAENAFEMLNTEDGSTEVIHSCLIDRVEPHHANGDQNPSASCNIDKKLYVCYSYTDPVTNKSGMDMVDLVLKLERKKALEDVSDVIAPYLAGATPDNDDLLDGWRALYGSPDAATESPAPRTYSERILESWAFIHPYLAERGVPDEVASNLQIGYDAVDNRITIPHFWHGALVGWQKRAIPDRRPAWRGTVPALPKYRSSPGFPKSTTLYRLPNPADAPAICVVESPFSTIRSVAIGCDIPVVATFGAKITDRQLAVMADFTRVYVWMDPDEAGASAERKVVTTLSRLTEVLVVTPDDGKDLGDYDDVDEVHVKIDAATPALHKMMEYQNG